MEVAASRGRRKKVKPLDPVLAKNSIEHGFTAAWIADAFGLSVSVVRRRLSDCPIKSRLGKAQLYDLAEAGPRVLRRPADEKDDLPELPPSLQKDLWQARLSEQKFRREAGELWTTETVLEGLTQMFRLVRNRVQIWPETVERQVGLSAKHRKLLVDLGDALLNDFYNEVQAVADSNNDPSAIALLEKVDGAAEE